ncbi:hypothetical protein JL720_9841 [Aureococcus anophagefferens]|nr:hypothetical protein JL720_9841 [Aureococcus anophagefferens]
MSMSLQIVDFVRAASPNERQQASRLAMACLTHVRRKGVRSILQDVWAHPNDVELSNAMEAALWCTVIRLPALLLCNPQAAVGPLFFAMFRDDYSARRFQIFKDRIEREALLRALDIDRSAPRRALDIERSAPRRALDIERSAPRRVVEVSRSPLYRALRRIEDAAPQEKHLVELTQEERYMLHAHIDTLTTGEELKACCVAFGLPPDGGPFRFGLPAARLKDFVDGRPAKKRRLT